MCSPPITPTSEPTPSDSVISASPLPLPHDSSSSSSSSSSSAGGMGRHAPMGSGGEARLMPPRYAKNADIARVLKDLPKNSNDSDFRKEWWFAPVRPHEGKMIDTTIRLTFDPSHSYAIQPVTVQMRLVYDTQIDEKNCIITVEIALNTTRKLFLGMTIVVRRNSRRTTR